MGDGIGMQETAETVLFQENRTVLIRRMPKDILNPLQTVNEMNMTCRMRGRV